MIFSAQIFNDDETGLLVIIEYFGLKPADPFNVIGASALGALYINSLSTKTIEPIFYYR